MLKLLNYSFHLVRKIDEQGLTILDFNCKSIL